MGHAQHVEKGKGEAITYDEALDMIGTCYEFI